MISKQPLQLPAYSLVLVLMVLLILSLLSTASLMMWGQQRRAWAQWVHAVHRDQLLVGFRDSLVSAGSFPEKGFRQETLLTDVADWPVTRSIQGMPWGFFYRLEVGLSDPAGRTDPVYLISGSIDPGHSTVLVISQAKNGLILSEGSRVKGDIVFADGSLQFRPLNWRDTGPAGFHSGQVIRSDKVFPDSSGLPVTERVPPNHPRSRLFSPPSGKDNASLVHGVAAYHDLKPFKAGPMQQVVLEGTTRFRRGHFVAGLFYLQADTVLIDSQTRLEADLVIYPRTQPTAWVKIDKDVQLVGDVLVAGVVQGEGYSVTGRLVCRDLQVYRPPTIYSGYLVNVSIQPGSRSGKPFRIPWQVKGNRYVW
ncbi:MAG: hypothetical protein HUU10_15330 [Bacteroidetes bacterium]|nr:hypothetical protein [Bacteroidota bacterium]